MKRCDIAIVGAGLVGLPLALALEQAGWQVVILDQRDPAAPIPSTAAPLCTALSAGTSALLEKWSLWSAVAADACPIHQVHITHKGYFGAARLSAEEAGVEALGHVIDNATFSTSLASQLASGTIEYLAPVDVQAAVAGSEYSCVHYREGTVNRTLETRLVIAVDGVGSRVRESVGITLRQVDYRQAAVLGNVTLEHGHEHIAHERFTSTGPLAMLPRPGSRATFAYCIDPQQQASIEAMDDDAFIEHLQSRFGHRLGRLGHDGPRLVVPLLRIEATRQIAPRTVLLGNAARLLHPVAGQGYNLAMRDAAELVDRLNETGAPVNNPGSHEILDAFVNTRRSDQQRVVKLTDSLARGFRGSSPLLSHCRSLGLIGLDSITPVRRRFAALSMGLVN